MSYVFLLDLARALVTGFGIILVLIIFKAVQERFEQRSEHGPVMVERPSMFALVSYICFAGQCVIEQFDRYGEGLTWRLPLTLAGLAAALLASRSMFTFQVLAWREHRAERKTRAHDH
jgi:hypothetical protein